MGMVLGPFFIAETDKYQHEQGKKDIQNYMLISAVICTALSITCILFFREKPARYPSRSAMTSGEDKSEFSLTKDLKLLLTNKNYIFMVISFNMLYGVYTTLGAIINNLVEPFGYTSTDSSIFGATFILLGLVGSFVCSSMLDKTQQYLRTLKIVCWGSFIMTGFIFLSLPSHSVWLLDLNIAILGIFILPIIPVGFAFSVELTYPVSEAMSNGLMMFFSQLIGTGITFVATSVAGTQPQKQYCTIMFITMMGLSAFSTLFIKEDLRRLNMSNEEEGK